MGNSFDKMRWGRWYGKNKRKILMLFFNDKAQNDLINYLFDENRNNEDMSNKMKLHNDTYTNELQFEQNTLRLWVSVIQI